jgi:hypothetical protein
LRQGRPNTIAVGIGDGRLIKAQVTITPQDGQTELRIWREPTIRRGQADPTQAG